MANITRQRPDNWVESLAIPGKSSDPLPALADALTRQMRAFGVTRPVVLLGMETGAAAIDELRRASGLAITAVDSFALSGDDLGDGVSVRFPDAATWASHDGVLCLDADAAAYLNGVQFCHDHGLDLPVLTDFDALPGQFCQTLVTSGDTETDIFVYNYFTKMYRVKDPLQMLWRVHWDDGSVTRGTYVMGANASVVLRPGDLRPPRQGETGTIVYEVHHPAFARVPNSRFRSYIDLRAPGSYVCHHGDEVTPKRVDAGAWFDTHACLIGGGHDLLIGVRKDVTDPDDITFRVTARPVAGEGEERSAEITLRPEEMQRSVSVAEVLGLPTDSPVMTRVVGEVSGRSYRFAWTEVHPRPAGAGVSLVGNHGSSNDPGFKPLVFGRDLAEPDPVLLQRFRGLADRRVLPLPYPLPVLPDSARYRFAFSAQKFLPLLDHMTVAGFDADGRLLGVETVALPQDLGYVDVRDTSFAPAMAERGGLLLISPPYAELGMVAYQNCREDLWIRLEDKVSGDADITEFQMHNRNLRGYTVPVGFGQAPGQIKARTELLIRYRCDAPNQTLLYVLNASPELDFDREAEAEIEFNLPDGRSASTMVRIPPQGVLAADVRDLLPDSLRDAADHGWLRVLSDKAALSAYCGLVNPETGACGLQHLLGA